MKIYVLSLPSDTARREPLERQLQSLGLDYEIFDAVDGRQGLAEEYHDRVDFDGARRTLGRGLGSGEAACAISHALIYEKILREGNEWTLVLEDDVAVDANLVQILANKTYQQCDLLLLNHRFSYVWPFSKTKLFDDFHSYRLLLPCWMTAGYVISRRGAEYLLRHTRPIRSTADWPGDITEISARVCVPVLVQHPNESASTLARERTRGERRGRFFKASYWNRWLRKRISSRIA